MFLLVFSACLGVSGLVKPNYLLVFCACFGVSCLVKPTYLLDWFACLFWVFLVWSNPPTCLFSVLVCLGVCDLVKATCVPVCLGVSSLVKSTCVPVCLFVCFWFGLSSRRESHAKATPQTDPLFVKHASPHSHRNQL